MNGHQNNQQHLFKTSGMNIKSQSIKMLKDPKMLQEHQKEKYHNQ